MNESPQIFTELVPENFEAEGQGAYWIAYPEHWSHLGLLRDRIQRAWGTGETREEALDLARERL